MDNITNVCKQCIPDNIKKEIHITKEWIETHIMSKEEREIKRIHLLDACARSHSLLQQLINHIEKENK
jgi:hypothetical protein